MGNIQEFDFLLLFLCLKIKQIIFIYVLCTQSQNEKGSQACTKEVI